MLKTERLAVSYLVAEADWLADVEFALEDYEPAELAQEIVDAGVLPPQFAHHYDAELLERFAVLSGELAVRLQAWPEFECRSSAEEILMHTIVERAVAELTSEAEAAEREPEFLLANFPGIDPPRERRVRLAVARRLDLDWELVAEDFDVLLLFDPRLDGIEDSPVAEQMRFANLRPDDWFKPFRERV